MISGLPSEASFIAASKPSPVFAPVIAITLPVRSTSSANTGPSYNDFPRAKAPTPPTPTKSFPPVDASHRRLFGTEFVGPAAIAACEHRSSNTRKGVKYFKAHIPFCDLALINLTKLADTDTWGLVTEERFCAERL